MRGRRLACTREQTRDALAERRQPDAEAREAFGRSARDMVLLSVGSGAHKKAYSYFDAKDWGLVQWARPALDMFMSGVSETVDYQLEQICGRKLVTLYNQGCVLLRFLVEYTHMHRVTADCAVCENHENLNILAIYMPHFFVVEKYLAKASKIYIKSGFHLFFQILLLASNIHRNHILNRGFCGNGAVKLRWA